jgi:hypothetical protein
MNSFASRLHINKEFTLENSRKKSAIVDYTPSFYYITSMYLLSVDASTSPLTVKPRYIEIGWIFVELYAVISSPLPRRSSPAKLQVITRYNSIL